MDVKKTDLPPALRQETPRRTEAKQQRRRGGPEPEADAVNLSKEARSAQAEPEEVREELVERIKHKIREGSYRPDIRRAAINLVHDDRTPLL